MVLVEGVGVGRNTEQRVAVGLVVDLFHSPYPIFRGHFPDFRVLFHVRNDEGQYLVAAISAL